MNRLFPLLEKARSSAFYRWVLNVVLLQAVPFNRPHRFKILTLTTNSIEIKMPYRRSNFNHIRGLHACGLATVSEYATGLLLISRLDPAQYRLIMKSMRMEYHYQGKMDGYARFQIDEDWLQQEVLKRLRDEDAILIEPQVSIFDGENNHLCTGHITWQIKAWAKVKTAVH